MGQQVWLCRLFTVQGDPAKKASWAGLQLRSIPQNVHMQGCIHPKGMTFWFPKCAA